MPDFSIVLIQIGRNRCCAPAPAPVAAPAAASMLRTPVAVPESTSWDLGYWNKRGSGCPLNGSWDCPQTIAGIWDFFHEICWDSA